MTEKLGKTLQLLLVFAVIFGSHYLMPIKMLIEPPLNYLGLPLIVAGALLDVWAASLFRARQTSFKLQGGAASLITDGPFGFSRNPIYLGIMAALLGLAVFLGSLMAFIYPAIFFVLFQFVFIPLEERRMEEAFGEEYLEYKRKSDDGFKPLSPILKCVTVPSRANGKIELFLSSNVNFQPWIWRDLPRGAWREATSTSRRSWPTSLSR